MNANKIKVVLITFLVYFILAYVIYYFFNIWEVFPFSIFLALSQSSYLIKKY